MNSVRSNEPSLKYQRFTPSGCEDIGMRNFVFVPGKISVPLKKQFFIIPLLEVRCNLLYFAPMPRVIFFAHFFHFQVVPHICDGKFCNLLFLEIIESWERLNEFQKWVAFTCVWGRTVSRCKSDRKFILGTVRVI